MRLNEAIDIEGMRETPMEEGIGQMLGGMALFGAGFNAFVAAIGLAVAGAPLLSLAAAGGTVLLAGSGLALVTNSALESQIKNAVKDLLASVEKRDELMKEAYEKGYKPHDLGPYKSKIQRATKKQIQAGSVLDRRLRADESVLQDLVHVLANDADKVRRIISAAKEGRLTAENLK